MKFKPTLPGEQIRDMIENQGLSMSVVARTLGKHVGVISNFCKRNNIKSKYLSSLKNIPINEVKDKYLAGMSMFAIAKLYQRPPALIKTKLVKAFPDLHIRDMDEAKRPSLLNDRNLLAEAIRHQSIHKLAKKLGVKPWTVISAIRRLKLTHLVKHAIITDKPTDILELYNSGVNLQALADVYHTYPTSIANIIRRIGGELRKSGGSPRPSHFDLLNDREWLNTQYVINKRSMNFIAAFVGASIGDVAYYLKKYGIPRRSPKETLRLLMDNGFQPRSSQLDTKWGTFRVKSQHEREFLESLPSTITTVRYEPLQLEYGQYIYIPDFEVDGELIEVKPEGWSRNPGVDRRRFAKQWQIAKLNKKDIRVWYDGYITIDPITDIDKYYAVDWRLFFKDPQECIDFLLQHGWDHPLRPKDMLIYAAMDWMAVPKSARLNANVARWKTVAFMRHFHRNYYESYQKGYIPVSAIFKPGNENILRDVIIRNWGSNKSNIYSLLTEVAANYTNFKMVSMFKPWVAREVYETLLPSGGTVVDPCAGWGGRMLATAESEYTYIGSDLNITTIDDNINMYHSMKSHFINEPQLSIGDARDILHEGDLLFTSPPYDDTEYYHGLDKQCTDTVPLYHNFMEFNGIVALNIPKIHEKLVIEIATKHNRQLQMKLEMRTRSLVRREKTYEPILVFKAR